MILTEAWHSWRRTRGVALLAVIAFAVGIGSTTAIFTVINGVLLRPLPYPESDRFVVLFGGQTNEPGQFTALTLRDAAEYQRRTSSFDVFGWFRLGGFNLTAPGEPQFLAGAAVTPSLAHNLGVQPALGRWFDDETGAVISNRLWKRLGGDRNVVGTPITVDGRRLTVTGVMPPTFRLPTSGTVPMTDETELWTFLGPSGTSQNPNDFIFFSYARRKPGVSFGQAEADVKRVAADIAALSPASHPSYTARLVPLSDAPFLELRSTMLVLFVAAGLLLLIACANVATLLLARSVARIRETAIRVALGAPRRHLAARYFVEALLVSAAGAAAGMLLSVVLVRVISLAGSELIPQADEIGIDWKVLGVGTLLTFIASALASAAPLWQALRTAPGAVLADGVRASASMRVRRLSQALVVAEIALAFVLLAVSTILVAHLQRLSRVSPGFNPENLLTFEIGVPRAVFDSRDRRPYQQRMVDTLAEVPSVSHVAFANQLPLNGCCFSGTLYPEGQAPTSDARRVSFVSIRPEYFATMGIPLRAGRLLTERDTSQDMAFGVINEAAARRYWPGRSPVGSYARLNRPDGGRVQILGVVGNVRNDGLKKPAEAELYLLTNVIPVSGMRFVVRSALSPARVISDVRRAVQRVDPTVVVHDVKTMNAIIRDSLQLERVSSYVMTFFALTALLMATLGIYGVVSYSVRQRTVELGTRMALGAVDRDILRLVVGGAIKMAVLGVAVGGVAVIGGVWLLVRFLEVRDIGAPPFLVSTVTVAAIAVAASYLPAWRATFLSPMVAIRDDATASAWQTMRRRMRRAMKAVAQRASGDSRELSPTALLTEFVAAARAADSFTDALRAGVAALCHRLGVERALLLERKSDDGYRCAVAIGSVGSTSTSVSAHGFLVKRLEAYPHPISFTHADLDALARWAEEHRRDRLAEIEWLRDAQIRTAVPLRTKTEILGVLLLGPAGDPEQLTPAEKEVLPACADQFALMIENARLTDRIVEQEKVRRDLTLAAEVQKRLLPSEVPITSIAEFAGVSVPARSIGGDYYDFIPVGDQQIGIALADVSGKGVAAALIMAAVQASLRVLSSEGNISLPRLAARLNQFLYQSTPANKYATFFYAQVDADRRELRYVNAGHNPPYLVRASHSDRSDDAASLEILELSAGGAVVGMFPELSYKEGSINLQSGDLLVAFTDGVTEAQNPGEEEFGEERLKELLRRVASLPVPEISARISNELKEWIGDAPQYDDLTFVVMKVN